MLFLLGGCLSKPAMTTQSFAFPLADINSTASHSAGGVLQIRQIHVAAPYDTPSFIYRTGTYSYERDPYAEFLVSPEESLLGPVQSYLSRSGAFSEVVAANSSAKPDEIADVLITALYGDFRNPQEPVAVLRMAFVFYRANQTSTGQVSFKKEYEQRIPFKTRTAAALMRAWEVALKHTMASVSTDLKSSNELQNASSAKVTRPE